MAAKPRSILNPSVVQKAIKKAVEADRARIAAAIYLELTAFDHEVQSLLSVRDRLLRVVADAVPPIEVPPKSKPVEAKDVPFRRGRKVEVFRPQLQRYSGEERWVTEVIDILYFGTDTGPAAKSSEALGFTINGLRYLRSDYGRTWRWAS